MRIYRTKVKKITGSTKYKEVVKKARRLFHEIEKQSKRSPYIRSAYFENEKIFFNLFWIHLAQKPERERRRRLQFLPCAYDLIENTKGEPVAKQNPNNKNEMLYRFSGKTQEGEYFCVQIKENLRTGRKNFMSVFPSEFGE